MRNFNLSEEFVEQYKSIPVKWGYGDLGYFIFKRTYARPIYDEETGEIIRTEQWWEVVKRVVEGCFSYQKKHCQHLGIPFDYQKAQRSAKKMYDKIFNFKFLPPGRGLWIAGTEFVDKHGAMSLNNCASYETEFITQDGVKRLGDCAGTTQRVLTKGGIWKESLISSFGKQQLYEVTLRRGHIKKTIFVTAGHRWYFKSRTNKFRETYHNSECITTELIPGYTIPYLFKYANSSEYANNPFAIAQGICFGDGTSNHLYLCGDKDKELVKYFPLNNVTIDNNKCNESTIRVSGIPKYYKRLPELDPNDLPFLYNWLRGYFAADGCCSKQGYATIASSNIDNIRFVINVCNLLGIGTYEISTTNRISNLTNKLHTMHSIRLMNDRLNEDFFLLSHHKHNFINNANRKTPDWKVLSVKVSDRFEEVYCATVPDTHCFALAGNILTGNCFAGTERFITNDGPIEFQKAYTDSWNGETFKVLVPSGDYVDASIKCYDTQETISLVVGKRVENRIEYVKNIQTTRDHRWIVRNDFVGVSIQSYSVDGQFAHVLTKDLTPGLKIPSFVCGDIDWEILEINEKETKSEMVYCLEVPEHHCFYLDDYVLTGNCGFVSTERIDLKNTAPFEWAMNSLMLGVGVGADVRGAGKIEIKQPKDTNSWTKEPVVFTIPDTREGWVEALRWKLKAYFDGKPMPTFDYSQIRPLGTPIKGFGGVASGYEPLKELLDYIDKILQPLIGQKITTTAIVDIFNLIARCVVSGNVRRSSEIILGNDGDEEFLNLKNPDLYKDELMHHRWGSNNSILSNVGKTDYSQYVAGIVKNGEPGFGWVDNARNYGRLKNGYNKDVDELVMGMNPCFVGDTLIAVADGRGAVPIRTLAEENKDVPVYSINSDNKVEIKWGRCPRKTRKDSDTVTIVFDDDSSLTVTPDHKFVTKDGKNVLAKDLQKGDSLPRLTKWSESIAKNSKDKYVRISCDLNNPRQSRLHEHKLIAKFFFERDYNRMYDYHKQNGWHNGGIVIHHKDFNSLNNSPDNLEIKSFKEHKEYHQRLRACGESNGMFGKHHSEKSKNLISALAKERMSDPIFHSKIIKAMKNGVSEETHKKISISQRNRWLSKHMPEIEKYNYFIDENGKVWIERICSNCGKPYFNRYKYHTNDFCSMSCRFSEGSYAYIQWRQNYDKLKKEKIHKQTMFLKDLQESYNRTPTYKEWVNECKKSNIPYRFYKDEVNIELGITKYSDFVKYCNLYNHRVKSVKINTSKQDVYNITVDDNHNVGIVLNFDKESMSCDGIFSPNCGEIWLPAYGLCNLVSVFPTNHDTAEEFFETLKYAYLYTKSVTLVNTESPETNQVVLRERRIGVSLGGIIDAFAKFGRRNFLEKWCDIGYEKLLAWDKIYSNWLCVPRSIKMTTVKPDGTLGLLAGVSPGIHYPHSKYYIRRVRISETSELVDILKKAGYHVEPDVYGRDTVVVQFPIKIDYFDRSKTDVTLWEQMQNTADLQYYWADNAVSVTVTFKNEEISDLARALECYEDKLKSVSFLRLDDSIYQQMPYETIDESKYEEMKSKISPIDLEITKSKGTGEKFCTNDSCTL